MSLINFLYFWNVKNKLKQKFKIKTFHFNTDQTEGIFVVAFIFLVFHNDGAHSLSGSLCKNKFPSRISIHHGRRLIWFWAYLFSFRQTVPPHWYPINAQFPSHSISCIIYLMQNNEWIIKFEMRNRVSCLSFTVFFLGWLQCNQSYGNFGDIQ